MLVICVVSICHSKVALLVTFFFGCLHATFYYHASQSSGRWLSLGTTSEMHGMLSSWNLAFTSEGDNQEQYQLSVWGDP